MLSSTIYPEGVDRLAQGRSEGIAADRAESARTRWNAAEAEDPAGAVGELCSTGEAAGGGAEEDPAGGGGGDGGLPEPPRRHPVPPCNYHFVDEPCW